jgi:hypothetical protein
MASMTVPSHAQCLNGRTVIDHNSVGPTPDVLVHDQAPRRLYVAAESGWVSVFEQRDGHTSAVASRHTADGAHSLALDPATHHSFFPIAQGGNGPVLREFEPTS